MLTRRSILASAGLLPQAFAANDRIQIGIIGAGGRAQHLMKSLVRMPGAKIVGVCDVWDVNIEKASQMAGGVSSSKNHLEFLQRKDLDAVLIASPDHWHVQLLTDACAAGKDVYVEKPLTHDLSEGTQAIDAQNKYRRIVQVGMQQRSMPHIQKAREIVRSGKLGKVHKVHLTWNRNTNRGGAIPDVDPKTVDWQRFLGQVPDQPFDAYQFRNWRWFWNFGGGTFTDLMVHWIDVAHWILDLDHPEEAVAIGDSMRPEWRWQTPDTAQCLLRYPKQGVQAYFESTFVNARNAAMIEFMGDEGTLYIDRGRYELHPELAKKSFPYEEMILGTGPRGADFYEKPDGEMLHLQNWLDAIRSRKPAVAPVEAGVISASSAHLANIALRSGQSAKWREDEGFVSLFDGVSLQGWEVDTPGVWSVRHGMIVGKHSGLTYNDFLRTKRAYGDFELRLQFRLLNGVGNSGVQFRSEPASIPHEVSGYQADVGQQYWGCLYDESRRKRVLAQAPAMPDLDKGGWNEYVIRAQGSRIVLQLNGRTTVDYEEREAGIASSGFLALQVHSGPGIEVHFRCVRIRELG